MEICMNDRPAETIIHPGADRWRGVKRDYSSDQTRRLTGALRVSHTLAERGADRLWQLLHSEPFVASLGALTGNQALQQVKAGLKAIYLSGWQVAADANNAGQMWCSGSTAPSSAPTRSSIWKVAAPSTSSRRSSPTPKPASAVRSTPSS